MGEVIWDSQNIRTQFGRTTLYDNSSSRLARSPGKYSWFVRFPLPLSTDREKAPIKNLYIEFKDLERRLAAIGGGEDDAAENALSPEMAAGNDVPADMESVKAEKKKVKREIQTWLEDFEAREGHAALQE